MLWRPGRPQKRPGVIEPCIPTLASRPPVGLQWIHEIKRDGYRMIAPKRDGPVRLRTRNGFDWTERHKIFPLCVLHNRMTELASFSRLTCCSR
jgi:ATP-dependent DNA ligase